LFSTLTFLTEMIVVPLQEKRLSFLTYKQKQIESSDIKIHLLSSLACVSDLKDTMKVLYI